MIHHLAQVEVLPSLAVVLSDLSIRRLLRSGCMQHSHLSQCCEYLLSRGRTRRKQPAKSSHHECKDDARKHDRRCDSKIEGEFTESNEAPNARSEIIEWKNEQASKDPPEQAEQQ